MSAKKLSVREVGRLLKAAFPPVKASPEFKEGLLRQLVKEAARISR